MNTKNVHVIRVPTITKIVMLFSILMCILLYKPITAEATSADCDKGYGIPSPSTMVDLATGKGAYWSSGGSWQSWIDFYKSMGYTYTGYSDCYMLYGANSSGHQTNEYVHGYWMDLTKNGQTYWAILRNDFGDTNTYYSRYNSWYCVNETLNGVNEYTWYYTNGVGIVYKNTWLHTRTHDPHPNKSDIHGYFCFNASGRMSVGWHKGTDGKWYYFRIDTVRGEDGANTRTGMSEHGGLIWNTVHSPTTYGANGLYSEGLYLFEGLDVATNVYRRNTNGTFDYVGTDVTRINAGSDSSQIEPFRSKKISSNTKYVNDQIYNTNALYINTSVAGTYTADQNVLLVNDDYQHIRVNEYTYYIDRKKFTLTQNINSDTETTKTSTIYYEGTQNISTPTKTGYKFDGWEVSGNGSKMDGNTFTMGDADATITAKWTPIDYTIKCNTGGGQIASYPTSYNINTDTITIPQPTKPGYAFAGWTGSNGNTAQKTVTIPKGSTGDKTYDAHWTPINYTISYDLQGGTMSGQKTSYNIETPTFSIPTPTKNGYTFLGWTGTDLTSASKSVTIKQGSIGNRTYKANWKANTYSITYNLNGGSISGQPTSYTIESPTLNIPRPTKTGHTFLGWTGSNGNTNQLDVSIAHGSTGNKAYTAHWKINTYTMTVNHYKYNQHTNKWDFIKKITDKANYGTVYIPKYDTPTGYYNHHRDWDKGWTVTGNGTFNVYYYPNSYRFDVNTWLDGVRNVGGYTDILFNVYINDKLVNSKVQDYGSTHLYGDTYKVEMISNSKYTYEKSVYTGTISGNTVVEPKAQTVPVVERLICGQSGNDNFYVYAYVSGLGSLNRVVFPSWTDEAGQDDLNPNWQTGEKADEKGNWTFNGQSYNYRKLIKSADHKRTGKDEHNWYNIHVYAYNGYGGKTIKTTTFAFKYNVAFNYNKPLNATSTINNSSETVRKVTYNTAYGTLPNPSMNGWTFNGWYTAATGGNKVDGTNIYKYAYGTTLYAHWTANKYTLTYTANGGNGADYYQTVTYDSYMETLTNRFTKTGYSFVGYKSDRTGEWAKYTTADKSNWGYNKGTVRFYDYTNNQWITYKLWYWKGVYSSENGCASDNDVLKAQWRANDYTITYNYNKPSNATSSIVNGSTANKVVTYDKTYGTLPTPSMRGWTFNGWYTAKDGGTKISSDMTYKTPNDITLYAHWSANIYEIKLDSKLEGCTGSTGTTVIYEKYDTGFYSDKACTKQITSITIPHKIGNAFNGYTDDRNIIIDINGAIKVKTNYFLQNTTLSAKWTLNTYRVIFNGNRNSSGKTDTLVYTWSNSDTNNKALTPNGYIRTGWNYINWNTINNGKGTAYNNNQMIGNKFFIDNLGKDVLLDGKSHDVTLYAQWKDITVPDIKEVTAEQETLLSKVNSGQLTLTSQSGAYNGELYTNLKIKIDENNADKDASGIKNVSVLVYDKNNTTVQKTYDITNNISYGTNTKYDFGYDGKYYPYSGTYTFKVNLYKEFPNASKLGIYVYCTDAQGNTTKRNDIFTRPSVDIPQDKPIVIPDKPIEGIVIDEINECIYSQYVTVEGSKDFGVGETGITTTWTYGYVERYDLDYREINTEMENEIANNELSADNRMNRSHEIGRDNNGKAPLASVDNQIVRIPPYVLQHLSTPDTTKHDDGTTKYKDLLNNKYTATGYKGTQETGIYNIYNIKDTEYQAVHYRSGI